MKSKDQNLSRQNSCDGKDRYESMQLAALAAARLTNAGNVKVRMVPYKCSFCNGYHFGHSKKRKDIKQPNKARRDKKKLDLKLYDYHPPIKGYCLIRQAG